MRMIAGTFALLLFAGLAQAQTPLTGTTGAPTSTPPITHDVPVPGTDKVAPAHKAAVRRHTRTHTVKPAQ